MERYKLKGKGGMRLAAQCDIDAPRGDQGV